MPRDSGNIGGITLVHSAFGDFFVPEDSALRDEVRETGGHARSGWAMLSPRLPLGGTVLDVGAGVGMLAIPLQLAVGNTGRVWCFEPDAGAFTLLRWNLAANSVDLLARAVAGDAWPRLDDWSRTAEIEHIHAIRVHGPAAAGALIDYGLEAVETHRPLILFTHKFRDPDPGREAAQCAAELAGLGYAFQASHPPADDETQEEAPLVAEVPDVALGGSVLAVPAGSDPAGNLDE